MNKKQSSLPIKDDKKIKPAKTKVSGDTEEISALFIIIILIQWVVYMGGLPVFLRDIFYVPAWLCGLLGFLFYSYFLIEIGFLKLFYSFQNTELTQ